MRIYGINPVLEALRAGRVTSLHLASRGDDRISEIVRLAESRGVSIARNSADALDRLAGGARHQGVVAQIDDRAALDVGDLIAGAADAPLLVVLDQI
jgi:23S rRNA (guanosine2251-2'-O)-methyltransferase